MTEKEFSSFKAWAIGIAGAFIAVGAGVDLIGGTRLKAWMKSLGFAKRVGEAVFDRWDPDSTLWTNVYGVAEEVVSSYLEETENFEYEYEK